MVVFGYMFGRHASPRDPERVRTNCYARGSPREACMADAQSRLDLRDVPPPERHPMIHDSFDALDSGEALVIVNDHDPKPLFYEMSAEVESFDAENYTVDEVGPEEFVATLPKK